MEDAVWPGACRAGCWCLVLAGALPAQPGAAQTLVVPVPEGKLFHVPNCGLAALVTGTRHHLVSQP